MDEKSNNESNYERAYENLEEGVKAKRPVKVQYFKDEKSLQVSIDFKKDVKQEDGCISQLKHKSFYQACFAEFIGTYILVLFAVGFGLNTDPSDIAANFTGALATGILVATLIWGLAQASGCHINPAVSVAFFVAGDINIIRVFFYIPCQLIGSCLAVMTLRGMIIPESDVVEVVKNVTLTDTVPQIGLTLLNPKVSPLQGVAFESIITFVLLLTIFACTDTQRKDLSGSFPLSIGFAVALGALMGGQFTGASMNPARSFGPAFMSGNLTYHYIYWIGPCFGGVLAALVYKLLTFKSSVRVVK